MTGNVIVGQSGGPTAVINATLAGVYEAAKNRGAKKIYGMKHGIDGLINESIIELNGIFPSSLEIELLKRTPSSFLGSCRFKLPEANENDEIYKRIFCILNKYDIKYLFYIGGNDSMDTIMKLCQYAKAINSDIKFIGVPKTIDNDLVETDHTPGYASAAKYICATTKELIRDATVYNTPYVTIIETMGRNAGWLTASTALAKDEDCEGVDLIYIPENTFNTEQFIKDVENKQKTKKSVIVAVSEGIKFKNGKYVCEASDDVHFIDSFGHKSLTGTARYLSKIIAQNLNTKVRSIELSTLQRCAGHITSRTDITESYQVGGAAVRNAFKGINGEMVTLKRISNDPYQCTTSSISVNHVANKEKKIPLEWFNKEENKLNEQFLRYCRPLIQAELTPIFINGLQKHIKL